MFWSLWWWRDPLRQEGKVAKHKWKSGVSHFLDHDELKQTSKKRKTKIGFAFKGGMLARQTAEGLNKGQAKVKDGYQKMKTRRRKAWNC